MEEQGGAESGRGVLCLGFIVSWEADLMIIWGYLEE
jgi:hypothetical protein